MNDTTGTTIVIMQQEKTPESEVQKGFPAIVRNALMNNQAASDVHA
jgi:hypothetical protein